MIVVVMGVCGCGKTTVGRGAGRGAGLAVPRRRRFPSAGERREDGAPARRSPTTIAGRGSTGSPPRCAAIDARGGHAVLACSALQAGVPRPARARRRRPLRPPRGRSRRPSPPRLAARARPLHAGVAARQPVRDARGAGRRDRRRHPPAGRRRRSPRSAAASTCACTTPMSATRQAPQARHARRPPRPRSGNVISAPSTRRCSAPRRSCSRRSPTSRRRRAASTPASPTGCTACRRSRDLQAAVARRSKAATRRSRCPRGSTATTLPLLALLKPGDHVLVTDSVYGPTRRFCDLHLTRLGVEVDLLRSARRRRRSSASSGRTRASCSPSRPGR